MAFSTDDTIVAIATPPGRGGIGVVRMSGLTARECAARLLTREAPLEPRLATFSRVRAGSAPAVSPLSAIDQVVATWFPAPHSYTGEDVVELSAHGSPVVLRGIVVAAMAAGARLAEPGEFTLRSFLNGRVDLVQAEAVADLIDAVTPRQARVAFDQLDGTLSRAIAMIHSELFDVMAAVEASLDFPEEGYHFVEPGSLAARLVVIARHLRVLLSDAVRGRMLREGRRVAILGLPNAGKSTLFNALVGSDRAIVAAEAGTTRDLVTEMVDVGGMRVTLVDTAGLRAASVEAEAEGVARARLAAETADLRVVVIDGSRAPDEDLGALFEMGLRRKSICVISKADLASAWPAGTRLPGDPHVVAVSALTGAGLDALRLALVAALSEGAETGEEPAVTNIRHIALLERAEQAIAAGVAAASAQASEEFVLADLQDARAALEEITGRRTADDVLTAIFSRFCVGK